MKLLTFLLILLLPPLVGNAENNNDYSGNDLLRDCKQILNVIDGEQITPTFFMGQCLGIIRGARVAATLINDQADEYGYHKHTFACIPKAATNEQLMRVVVNYLQEQPQILHHDGQILLMGIFRQTFPCK